MLRNVLVLTNNDRVTCEDVRDENKVLPHVHGFVEHLNHVFLDPGQRGR